MKSDIRKEELNKLKRCDTIGNEKQTYEKLKLDIRGRLPQRKTEEL